MSAHKNREVSLFHFGIVCRGLFFAKGGEGVSRTITLDSKKKNKKYFEISCLNVAALQWDLDHRHPKMEAESWWSHPMEGRKSFPSFPLGSLDDLILNLT